jgi:hypothetical protein
MYKKKSILDFGGIVKGRRIGKGNEREYTKKVVAGNIVNPERKIKTTGKIIINRTLIKLLNELGKECEETLKLLSQLEVKDLSSEQTASILSELAASVVHLHAHTEGLQEMINEEMERV